MAQDQSKVKSALELAKFKPGDKPYWIISRCIGAEPVIDEEDSWMFSESIHPKTPYRYGVLKGLWPYRAKLPKLHASDFTLLVEVLNSHLIIEEFEVALVVRCQQTGEFIYQNTTAEEWMPESHLFESKAAARKERDRIKRLIGRWAAKPAQDPT